MKFSRRVLAAASALLMLGSGAAFAQAPAPADSLKVTLCGTSGPLPVRDRAKPCVAIQAGGSLYLVDIGSEASENLQLWRMPIATTRAVFITHLHSDHIGDLGEFNMQSWVAGRPAPLQVVGPPGVEHLAAGLNEAYGPDHGFRHAHHEHGAVKLPIAAGLLQARVIPMPAKPDAQGVQSHVAWRQDGLTVTAIAVNHKPVAPAYAYRFDYKGRSVVVSGDTIKWLPLATASKGADVLIHEAQNNGMTRQLSDGLAMIGQDRMSSILGDTVSYHTTPVEAAEIAKLAGVKQLVLTHLTQAGLPFFTPEAFTKGIDAVGFPNWRLAKDGMTIDLPVGGDEIRFGQN
ncbi:MBL fold metallo-hydrolase [Phenylobacterium aquaticum]|uniref:MBL fold metallo-hydrolase n=1 Tax=Phenylobacterium aquaticum TaxID=1763816 RepID=UPI0026EB2ED4|nr:MBL fold metallo-hydrolase [Phenylobacterium aquaticum]